MGKNKELCGSFLRGELLGWLRALSSFYLHFFAFFLLVFFYWKSEYTAGHAELTNR